jgi:hypothetical protein
MSHPHSHEQRQQRPKRPDSASAKASTTPLPALRNPHHHNKREFHLWLVEFVLDNDPCAMVVSAANLFSARSQFLKAYQEGSFDEYSFPFAKVDINSAPMCVISAPQRNDEKLRTFESMEEVFNTAYIIRYDQKVVLFKGIKG